MAVRELGGIDILVNNAAAPGGTVPSAKIDQVTSGSFGTILGILRGLFGSAGEIAGYALRHRRWIGGPWIYGAAVDDMLAGRDHLVREAGRAGVAP